MDDDERTAQIFWVGAGGALAIAVAAALVSVRSVISSADVALALVLVVVVAAISGGRKAGAASAVMAAVSFDFFFTKPYNELRIASGNDIVTTLLLLGVGLSVGHVAAKRRQADTSAARSHNEVRRIYRVAELAARGDDASDVILGAQAELTALLGLQGCRFEREPHGPPLPTLERSGVVAQTNYRMSHGELELPSEGVELSVLGRGHVVGRFVLLPTAGAGASLEQRVVAVAVADQVGAVLVAPHAGESGHATDG